MFRPLVLAFALSAAPAAAQPYYQAQPAAQPAEAKVVARDILWNCGAGTCSAAKNHSRPAIVCSLLVKEVGALVSFSVAGEPVAAADLEKCNARAR